MTLEQILARTQARESGFRLMVEHLTTINDPLIIETGCARGNTPEGDGWSTVLWDRYIVENSGKAYSVDITPAHVEFSTNNVQKLEVVLGDSVKFLYDLGQTDVAVDVLYLDSYDFIPGEEHNSALHHILELAGILHRLKSGSLVAVDDCFFKNGERDGKGVYVHKFMENLGKELIHDSYQMIWRW
jgi:predicted O-methyltransferase YrrM